MQTTQRCEKESVVCLEGFTFAQKSYSRLMHIEINELQCCNSGRIFLSFSLYLYIWTAWMPSNKWRVSEAVLIFPCFPLLTSDRVPWMRTAKAKRVKVHLQVERRILTLFHCPLLCEGKKWRAWRRGGLAGAPQRRPSFESLTALSCSITADGRLSFGGQRRQ